MPNKRKKPKHVEIEKPQRPAAFEVRMSKAAETAYQGFYQRAQSALEKGDTSNQHCTNLRMIDDVIENVIPRDPFNHRYALTGNLSRIYRMQKGRLRICWMGSSTKRVVYIVFISETLRKQGDVNDPYELLASMARSGELDAFCDELGIPRFGVIKPNQIVP
jgi:mRNA-degrading endonuclease RelE of RelBE toxin-antitoxin system